MGPRYDAYFNREWEEAPSRRTAAAAPFGEQVRAAIQRGIDDVGLPYPVVFRPDARQFLLVNLQSMVVDPASSVDPDQLQDLVLESLPNDVALIVKTAAANAAGAGDPDVSAHDVLAATAQLWPDLDFAAPWRWEK
jgi:hypothetical protein